MEKRVVADWEIRFGHRLLLLETFVDPERFHGGVYRAANWINLGLTQGYRRVRKGYSTESETPKLMFVRPLCRGARTQLNSLQHDRFHRPGGPKLMLNAEQMRLVPEGFKRIPDPRRSQGRRHPLSAVLAIAAGATLCGMRGYKAIAEWANALGQPARERFGCRRENGRYVVPSESIIRDCLIRVEPGTLDRVLNLWNQAWGQNDEALALDGKTMKNAMDENGNQTHIMSVGRSSVETLLRPKKWALPVEGSDEQKRTNEIGMAIPLLETCDIAGKVITGDALLTQRAIATHIVQQNAH